MQTVLSLIENHGRGALNHRVRYFFSPLRWQAIDIARQAIEAGDKQHGTDFPALFVAKT